MDVFLIWNERLMGQNEISLLCLVHTSSEAMGSNPGDSQGSPGRAGDCVLSLRRAVVERA